MALRAHYADESLKQQIVNFLVAGVDSEVGREAIDGAVADCERMESRSRALASDYVIEGGVALVKVGGSTQPFDKTMLLLLGQEIAPVSVVVEHGNASIAAAFDSGIDFVKLLELGGGMPTRVSVPAKRLPDALAVIRQHLSERKG